MLTTASIPRARLALISTMICATAVGLVYFLTGAGLFVLYSQHPEKPRKVVGRDDWTKLHSMSRDEVGDAFVYRMKIMYHMIHATDHPEAPKFMSRAYRRAVHPLEPIEQFKLDLVG